MTTGASRPAELFQLDRTTCIVLLGTQHVGRLVFGGADPAVVPVNYRLVDAIIVFRTDVDGSADRRAHEQVAFEVDMFDQRTHSGWSVVVHGHLRPLADERLAELESWAPGDRDRWLAIGVDAVTGRLLRGAVDAPAGDDRGYL